MTFDQQYTHARAAIEGGDWKLRAEIADLQAQIATSDALLAEAKTIINEKNAKILDLKRNKGIDEMTARIAELEAALEDLKYLAPGAVEEEMTTDELAATMLVRIGKVLKGG